MMEAQTTTQITEEIVDWPGCREARIIAYDFHTRTGATALESTVERPNAGLRGLVEKAKLIAGLAFILARNKDKNLS